MVNSALWQMSSRRAAICCFTEAAGMALVTRTYDMLHYLRAGIEVHGILGFTVSLSQC